MKNHIIIFLMLAFLPPVAHSQADQKLVSKAQQGDPSAMILLGECYENGAGVAHDSTLALKWFQKAADLGDCEGWIRLSRYYLYGTVGGLSKDTARYFAIRKEWADKGCPNAIAALALAYEMGYGCKKDTVKALELYEKAIGAGSSWAYEFMGNNYLNGLLGLEKEQKKGVAYLEKAAKSGTISAYGCLANHYSNIEDYKKAWKYAKEGMKWADPNAASLAAHMYMMGYGVKQDSAMAMRIMDSIVNEHHNLTFTQWLAGSFHYNAVIDGRPDTASAFRIWKQGDSQGSSFCQLALGRECLVQERYQEAYAYFKKVMDNKHGGNQGEACWHIAYLYFNGLGVEEDVGQGEAWLKRGADEYRDAGCAYALGTSYMGRGDAALGAKYFRLSDQYGDTTAMAELGRHYAQNGNMDMAADCFQTMIDRGQNSGYHMMAMLYDMQNDAKSCNDYLFKGDKMGNPNCSEVLGYIYENGLDNYKVDYKKASKYYEKSGTPKSLYRLGVMYIDGMLGKQKESDIAKGVGYISRAAEQGDVDAIYSMGYLYETGSYVDTVDYERAVSYFKYLADNNIAAGQYKMGLYYELGIGSIVADSSKSVEYYQMAAGQGYGAAMCSLADLYRDGSYLPKDKAKAFALYSHAHEGGAMLGTYYVGRSYLEGCGVEIDTATAIAYLKAAADGGVGDAAYQIAEMYNYGLGGLEPNGDSAILYYVKGHENGSGGASYFIGSQLLEEGSYDKATDYLYVGAERDNVDAIVLFAQCLKNGIGCKDADPKLAYQMFEEVANSYGDSRAYYHLGLACLQGSGCPEDEPLGKAYLDTAVNLGSLEAMFTLGICYLNGLGCRVDTSTAIFWLEKSADNENVYAINQIGKVYEAMGDFKNAVLYYEKGITKGSLESYCNLGYCYEQGQGVVLNSQKAFELYKYAAEQGYTRGCRSVAGCYLNGIYVEPNPTEALRWLTVAAENGDAVAMYYCGVILEEGEDGVPADPKKAKEWFKKAASIGYDPAAAALSRMK